MSEPIAPPTGWADPSHDAVFEQQRGFLFGLAYRLTGSATDAEDVVQDAYLRWRHAPAKEIRNPRAFLATVATRLALDALRARKRRQETYPGPWLPEPVATTGEDPAQLAEAREDASMAVLVLLEALTPLERTVFVLREAFGFSFQEISGMIGRDPAAVRQLGHRARGHVGRGARRFDVDRKSTQRSTEAFLRASADGDVQALLAVLAPDVRLVTDGGGQARAARNVISGADKVARFLVATAGHYPGTTVELIELNGEPAAVAFVDGALASTLHLERGADGLVTDARIVANPDKLRHLASRLGRVVARF